MSADGAPLGRWPVLLLADSGTRSHLPKNCSVPVVLPGSAQKARAVLHAGTRDGGCFVSVAVPTFFVGEASISIILAAESASRVYGNRL